MMGTWDAGSAKLGTTLNHAKRALGVGGVERVDQRSQDVSSVQGGEVQQDLHHRGKQDLPGGSGNIP